MVSESFSDEQVQAIRVLLQHAEAERQEHAMRHVVMGVSRAFKLHPLVVMEELLREMGSETYLLGMPFDELHMVHYEVKLPHSGAQTYPYYLYSCFDGPFAAREKMQEIETNAQQNLVNLSQTGLRVLRQR